MCFLKERFREDFVYVLVNEIEEDWYLDDLMIDDIIVSEGEKYLIKLDIVGFSEKDDKWKF